MAVAASLVLSLEFMIIFSGNTDSWLWMSMLSRRQGNFHDHGKSKEWFEWESTIDLCGRGDLIR